ncbi:magnesium transporter CorA family protein [Mangrovibrevibacter kandeliae]|uniref:magnesium transporter CorA family protein n=1 Tax=Mangrovibrevibacter kandeliae TaxID=2968473 RepID=UPI0021191706|nr:magnesium transporter CorA family protein [Aurantimonas sp. CSK15Z-1]MCQ8780853.1 magnesium transporter CorA family protein [Aurantimonas sp. CSK15Z-1]
MIIVYRHAAGRTYAEKATPQNVPTDAIWIDLLDPSAEEERAVEAACGLEVPTREEMREIEASSRLYSEGNADFMTASIVYGLEKGMPSFAPVTFILDGVRLITLRYTEPKSFVLYASKLCKASPQEPGQAPDLSTAGEANAAIRKIVEKAPSGDSIMIGLIETVIDRLADMLEMIAADLDQIGTDIFAASKNRKPTGTAEFKEILARIGAAGDFHSRARESLATLDRLLPFLQMALDRHKPGKDTKARVKAMARDIHSLNDFVAFLSQKTNFLLDTTVGMISIEQNAIIKIFSVAAVGFMPPTLVASIYGMNFKHMPELSWPLGYPMAIGLMILSAVLPLVYFRHKKWL